MAGDAFMCLTEGNIAPGILANFKGRPSGSTLLQDKDGLILVFHLDSPTETEINAAKKHNLMTAYYLNGPYWLGQVRSTENSIFSFDFSFNIYGSNDTNLSIDYSIQIILYGTIPEKSRTGVLSLMSIYSISCTRTVNFSKPVLQSIWTELYNA